ncbi:MAG: hypothetical protein K9I82_17300 [Chitinophagaceae bacterium]|nr:hypothetical protein [Chitinophagaceae bacterium]
MIKRTSIFSKNNISKFILTTFLIYYGYIFSLQIFSNIQSENGYTLGDWLINYEDGGFKRRGLSGSFFILLYDLFGVRIKVSVFILQFFLNLLFVGYFYLLLLKRQISFTFLFLVLSPCTFLFFFNDLGSIGRKEIILFSAFAFYLHRLTIQANNIWKVYYPFIVIIPLGVLFHELFFFYSSFFLIPLFTIDKDRFSHKSKLILVLVFLGLLIFIVSLIFFLGGELNQAESFNILESKGISPRMRNLKNLGILTWNDNFNKLNYFAGNNYLKYVVSLIIGFSVFFVFTLFGNLKFNRNEFLFFFFFTFLLSIPVYILAIDWGRWLNIQFVLTLLFFTYALNQHKSSSKRNSKYAVSFIIYSFILILFWRFDLVDKGFYLSNVYSKLFN